jgi:predicted MFS family arabinose efflux permease
MFGVFFYVSLYMQQVLGYSPVQAGAAFLPMTVLIILIAPQAGRLTDTIGARWLVGGGMTLLAGSLFLFSRMGLQASFWTLLPAMILGGAGMGLVMTPTTATAMGAVQRDKAGVGSAVLNSMRQIGGSLGIALMGTIVASETASSLKSGNTQPVAFVHGLHGGLEVAAIVALAGALIAVLTLQKVQHAADPAAESATAPTFAEAG